MPSDLDILNIDFHFHSKFDENFILPRGNLNSTGIDDIDKVISAEICDGSKFIGFHPWYLNGYNIEYLRDKLMHDSELQVGEIGLDKRKGPDMSTQIYCFKEQFDLAISLNRDVSIHNVKAMDLLLPIFKEHIRNIQTNKIILHAFNGTVSDVKALSRLEGVKDVFLYSFGLRETRLKQFSALLKNIPRSKVRVESDGMSREEWETVKEARDIVEKYYENEGLTD